MTPEMKRAILLASSSELKESCQKQNDHKSGQDNINRNKWKQLVDCWTVSLTLRRNERKKSQYIELQREEAMRDNIPLFVPDKDLWLTVIGTHSTIQYQMKYIYI